MGQNYDHLNQDERLKLFLWRSQGASQREMARRLGRAPSTISRELRRNAKRSQAWSGGYEPVRAQRLAERRRRIDKSRFKMARQPTLRQLVTDRLAMGWSPAQIAGRLALNPDGPQISHESIYRYIWHRRDQKEWLYKLLPSGRSRRRPWRRRRRWEIQGRRPLSERPATIDARARVGDWEADVMRLRTPRGGFLVLSERRSRRVAAVRLATLEARATADALIALMKPLPAEARRSLTFDNGSEFTDHQRVATALGAESWFCPPYAPWTKGGVENAIGRLRRVWPRSTDMKAVTDKEIDDVVHRYNSTPRACLGYRTPQEAFNEDVALQS